VTEQESLTRFGISPPEQDIPAIRNILREATEREQMSQGSGDTELMKLCCVQLFCAGRLDDVLDIWRAKCSSMDAGCSIDIQLLCGAGLSETKMYLKELDTEEAAMAIHSLLKSEAAGDFEGFSIPEFRRVQGRYYQRPTNETLA
jgi:hypothetical protein